MFRRRVMGRIARPFLAFFVTAGVFAGPQLWAQSAPPSQPQSPEQQTAPNQPPATQPAPGDTAQPQAAPDSQSNPTQYPNEQQRVELARRAQERLRERRRQRLQAAIQDTYSHKYEISGGYTFIRLRPGHSLQNVSENGWNLDFTDYLRPRFGITADARGYYGAAYVGNNIYRLFEPSISNYGVMAGPQYRLKEGKTWGISGQVLVGGSRNLFYGDSNDFPGTLLGLYANGWCFSGAAGAPIDYNLGPALAVRVTPTLYVTQWGGDTQYSRGFTGGVVYRFGRQ